MPKIFAKRLRDEEQAVIFAAVNYINAVDGQYQKPDYDPLSAFSDLLGAVSAYDRAVESHRVKRVYCARCGGWANEPSYLNGMPYCDKSAFGDITCYENAWIGARRSENG